MQLFLLAFFLVYSLTPYFLGSEGRSDSTAQSSCIVESSFASDFLLFLVLVTYLVYVVALSLLLRKDLKDLKI